MRNLKRALSLALASVMLLGMMVVGTSAAFADADEIVNTEAVEITAGLGLFAGSDGKFNPKGNVTRAQMATVIVKMLYGSEINADQYKGIAKFNDVASFEGGWAEGYVNLCANLGIVGGYGDGSFKPGNSVTTAEAVTMIINALGVDAGKGTWPLTVMAKAEEMKLFEELAVKPATNVALTRDELASVVLEGLKYSPAGNSGYSVTVDDKTFTFDNIADAVQVATAPGGPGVGGITEIVGEDTLAKTVFEMISVSGIVTENQATGADATIVGDVELALETGLDMIGHYVTAYYAEEYQSEEEPGKAYCIVDEASYVTVDKDIENSTKEYRTAFGKSKVEFAQAGQYVNGTYAVANIKDADAKVKADELLKKVNAEQAIDYVAGTYAPEGTYMIFEGKIIGFFAPATKKVVEITKVVTTAGKEKIYVDGKGLDNSEDLDVVVEYEGIAKDDIAVAVTAGTMTVLLKTEKFDGQATKKGLNADGDEVVTIDGKSYVIAGICAKDKDDVDLNYTYTFYTYGGKIVAFEELSGTTDLGNIVYVVGAYEVSTNDAYGNYVTNAYAQTIDMSGKEASVLIGVKYTDDKGADKADMTNLGVYIEKDAEGKIVLNEGKANEIPFDAEKYAAKETFQVYEQSKASTDEKKAGIMVIDTKAIDEKPVKDENSIFADQVKADSATFDSKTIKVETEKGELAFLSDSTKFIMAQGAKGEALEIAVLTGAVKLNAGTYDVIASADKQGNVTLEAVVYLAKDVKLPSSDLIYVSAAQIAAAGTVLDAVELEVYFVESGKFETIQVADTVVPVAAGFYSYSYNATDKIYDKMDKESGSNLYYDNILDKMYGGDKLITKDGEGKIVIDGINAADAVVIDTRSAKELEKSEYDVVESLDDLTSLISEEIKVTIDVMMDEDLENVVAIFVTAVEEIKAAE